MSTTPTERTPGLLVVYPRLKKRTDLNTEDLFKKWTPLHYRDLLNVSVAATGDESARAPKFIRETRSVAPNSAAEAESVYSHEDKKGKLSPYLYTSHVEDIALFQSEEYMGVTRRVDIEKTRALGEGEEGVNSGWEGKQGEELMVWDLQDAEFAVFGERVGGYDDDIIQCGSFTDFPISATGLGWHPRSASSSSNTNTNTNANTNTNTGLKPGTHIIALHLPLKFGDLAKVREVQGGLLHHFDSLGQTLFSSVYQHAGMDKQAPGHPPIGVVGEGDWLVMIMMRGPEEQVAEGWKREDVEKKVEAVMDFGAGVHGEGMSLGVWELDLVMA